MSSRDCDLLPAPASVSSTVRGCQTRGALGDFPALTFLDCHCPSEVAGGGLSPHLTDGEQVQTGKQLGQGSSARKWQSWEENPGLQTPCHKVRGPSWSWFLRRCCSRNRPKSRDFQAQLFPKCELRQGLAWRGGGKGPTTSCSGWRGPHEVVIRSRPLPGLGRLPLSEPGGSMKRPFRAAAWTASGLFSFPPLTASLSTATNGRKLLRAAFPVPCPQLSTSLPVASVPEARGSVPFPALLCAGRLWVSTPWGPGMRHSYSHRGSERSH